jgi:ABC-2 type transport system ATP-binding protein
MDEPTSGFDPNQTREVRDLIRSLASDRTVILSTHILPEVEATCSRVIIINRGQIIAVDTPSNLSRKVRGNERIFVEAGGPPDRVAAALRKVPGVISLTAVDEGPTARFHIEAPAHVDLRPRIAQGLVEQGLPLLELRKEALSLEDIFHELTTSEEGAAS